MFSVCIRLLLFLGLLPGSVLSQPYIDLVGLKYSYSPASSGVINQDKTPISLGYANIGCTLPIPTNKAKTDAILLMPYYENWQVEAMGNGTRYRGWGLSAGMQKMLSAKFRILALIIYRYNKEEDLPKAALSSQQWGGVLLANYIRNDRLTLKLGVYYNKEFFGNFLVPLGGLDWQLNSRNNIFGTLPGAITWERKINTRFYYGANFRAITNSYRSFLSQGYGYWRIDENQLGGYADYYVSKHLVLTGELGHSILRKVRTGYPGQKKSEAMIQSEQDNLYLRLSMAYRLRLR